MIPSCTARAGRRERPRPAALPLLPLLLLLLLLLACLPAVPGCKDRCAGLEPQVEVTIQAGSGIPLTGIQQFEIKASLDGKTWKTRYLTTTEAGFADGRGRFVLTFSQERIGAGARLWLKIQAMDSQKVAVGKAGETSADLGPDGCNFVTVTLGKGPDGGTSGPPTLVLLSSGGAADIEVIGPSDGDELHPVVACDFDADGFDDLAVAAPRSDGWIKGQTGAYGRVYIIVARALGGKKESIDLANTGRVAVTIYGAAPGDQLGSSLACGDLDKDGYADLVIGAPHAMQGKGRVYLFRGGKPLGPATVDLGGHAGVDSGIASTVDVEITGGADSDGLGTSLVVTDFEGTGFLHLAMGAPGYDGPPATGSKDSGAPDKAMPGDSGSAADLAPYPDWGLGSRADAGAVFLVPYKTLKGRARLSLDLPGAFLVIQGGKAGEALGSSLAAGRLDPDKAEDLVAGAPGLEDSTENAYGGVRVLRGRDLQGTYPRIDCSGKQNAHSLTLVDILPNTGFGRSVAVGDLDVDGFDDVAVGAPLAARVQVFLGGASLLPPLSSSARTVRTGSSENKATYAGPAYSSFGGALAAPRRSSGKTAADLLVGAPEQDSGRGAAYWFRRAAGYKSGEQIQAETSPDVLIRVLGPQGAVYRAGTAVAGGRITSDDNVGDILVGAPHAEGPRGTSSGRVYGVLGTR